MIASVVAIGAAVWFTNIARSIIVTATAFRALSLAFLANPMVLAITAIVAALGLLIDEIYVTIKGGDSLINDFLKSDAYKAFAVNLNSVIDTLKEV